MRNLGVGNTTKAVRQDGVVEVDWGLGFLVKKSLLLRLYLTGNAFEVSPECYEVVNHTKI